MTEQELLKKIGTLTTPEHLLECAKAYADARESKEIAETRRKFELCKLMQSSSVDVLCAYDTEIAELKAEISELKLVNRISLSEWEKECDQKEAELKRLREGIAETVDYIDYNQSPNERFVKSRLLVLLSPAPVTETLNEDQHE